MPGITRDALTIHPFIDGCVNELGKVCSHRRRFSGQAGSLLALLVGLLHPGVVFLCLMHLEHWEVQVWLVVVAHTDIEKILKQGLVISLTVV